MIRRRLKTSTSAIKSGTMAMAFMTTRFAFCAAALFDSTENYSYNAYGLGYALHKGVVVKIYFISFVEFPAGSHNLIT